MRLSAQKMRQPESVVRRKIAGNRRDINFVELYVEVAMADEDTLPPPLEIPWRLASTTLPFSNGEADQTSITLFTHIPDDEVLTAKFPDVRLVYIKVTASISRASFPISPPFPS